MSETITDDGVAVFSITRTDAMTTMTADSDADGSEDLSRVVTRGASSAEDVMVETTWSAMHVPVARKTYTWTDAETIHVVIEHDDGSGTLVQTAEYDTPRLQPTGGLEPTGDRSIDVRPAGTPLAITTSGCSAADGALITQRLTEAMDGVAGDPRSGGLTCLSRLRFPRAKMNRLISAYMRQIEITCDTSLTAQTAHYDGSAWFDYWPFMVGDGPFRVNPTRLTVNPRSFSARTAENQRQLLFHEMLHELGEHDTSLLTDPRITEIDPTEACAATCQPSSAGGRILTTRCSCALCLGTDTCDPRCAAYAPCLGPPIPALHGRFPCSDCAIDPITGLSSPGCRWMGTVSFTGMGMVNMPISIMEPMRTETGTEISMVTFNGLATVESGEDRVLQLTAGNQSFTCTRTRQTQATVTSISGCMSRDDTLHEDMMSGNAAVDGIAGTLGIGSGMSFLDLTIPALNLTGTSRTRVEIMVLSGGCGMSPPAVDNTVDETDVWSGVGSGHAVAPFDPARPIVSGSNVLSGSYRGTPVMTTVTWSLSLQR
jgi:hypothetical protein